MADTSDKQMRKASHVSISDSVPSTNSTFAHSQTPQRENLNGSVGETIAISGVSGLAEQQPLDDGKLGLSD